MRVGLLHYAVHPVIGGVEQIISQHAKLLRADGHTVLTVARRGEPDFLLRGSSRAELAEELRTKLGHCDIVIAHNVLTMPFDLPLTEALVQVAAEHPRVRWVSWVHDLAALNPDLQPTPPVPQQADAAFEYVAVSEFRRQQFQNLTGTKCTVIPNGIDPAEVLGLGPEVSAFVREKNLLEGGYVLLHPTRLLRRKNVELGIALTRSFRDDFGEKVTLLVTGAEDPHNPASQGYTHELDQMVSDHGLGDRVFFVGRSFPIRSTELSELYRVSDALWFPSRQEGFGLPVLEAALHRMPALISDIEALNEIGMSSHRFSLEEPVQELAGRTRAILQTDPRVAERRRVLNEYDWDVIYARRLRPFLRC